MESIGIRELRQEASVHVRAVAAGQSLTVTDRGRPVARLVPVSPLEEQLARDLAAHELIAPTRARRLFADDVRLSGAPLSGDVEVDRDDRSVFG